MTQVKTCFDCKMFDVANWVACLDGEDGPGGMPSHEALSVSSQGALEISSVAGQPPSLKRCHFCTPRLVAESCKRDERLRPSSQRPQYPTLYRRLKRRLGRSLRSKIYQGSVVRPGEKATHKCPRVEGGLTGPSKFQGPKAWDIDALNINWTGLTAYAYPPTALLHRVIQNIRQCHCLIIVIAPGWPGMPWFWNLVQLSTEIPLQLLVLTTLLKQSQKYVFHNNPQHLNLQA